MPQHVHRGVRHGSVTDQMNSSPTRAGKTRQGVSTSYVLGHMMRKYTTVVLNNK